MKTFPYLRTRSSARRRVSLDYRGQGTAMPSSGRDPDAASAAHAPSNATCHTSSHPAHASPRSLWLLRSPPMSSRLGCFAATVTPGHDAVEPRPATRVKGSRGTLSTGSQPSDPLFPFIPPLLRRILLASGFWLLNSRRVLQFPSNSVVTTITSTDHQLDSHQPPKSPGGGDGRDTNNASAQKPTPTRVTTRRWTSGRHCSAAQHGR